MATDSLPILIKKRSAMKAKLTHFNNHLNSLGSTNKLSDMQRIDLEGRFSKFDALYADFDALQLDIEVQSDAPDSEYEERAQFEERYHALAAQARSLLASAGSGDSESVTSSASKSVKTVHAEFVTLLFLNRVVALQGKPKSILYNYSINFVGSNNKLRD
ncbi:uncharacterized protein LOC114350305 isoform X9 [Ostrinia furnacalis]|uniref:uncharacterized protein LOC114350305 isoform X9 n=1 Tax=Ostrinia furnacalis TaxID=93504 RepID=UPI0010394746|nr:uncharacterized protein LOC114350305 isoform X9 [Ostrinia furnacalis]